MTDNRKILIFNELDQSRIEEFRLHIKSMNGKPLIMPKNCKVKIISSY